ncbi:MAG: hypothetical protein ACPKPY_12765 [Nitrososphaeraceae archaeon]
MRYLIFIVFLSGFGISTVSAQTQASSIEIFNEDIETAIDNYFERLNDETRTLDRLGKTSDYSNKDGYEGVVYGADLQYNKDGSIFHGKYVFIEGKLNKDITIMFSFLDTKNNWSDDDFQNWINMIVPKVIDKTNSK